MRVEIDKPLREETIALLREHLAEVSAISPAESTHALDVDALDARAIMFWAAWDGDEILGCGALLELDREHGEIKSMRTARRHLRRGVASAILVRLIEEARGRGYARLSLETGAQEHFVPARALYERFGFERCGPFGRYKPDVNSVFMSMRLGQG